MSRLHIVRTCRIIRDDVEPSFLPSIPRGTYGIALPSDAEDFAPVDFGPPWGVQRIGNHHLLDAPAVLLGAKRAIECQRRPWRNVIRRTLRTFAGLYLRLAVVPDGDGDPFAVEAHLHWRRRKDAIKLIDRAVEIARSADDVPAVVRRAL